MRYPLAFVAMLVLFLCSSYVDAPARESGDFIDWALQQGEACDVKWNDFVQSQPGCPSPTCGLPRRTGSRASGQIGPVTRPLGSLQMTDRPFLPRSTRDRGGPSRGTTALQNPAAARLNVPYDRLRPAKSSFQLRSHTAPRAGAVRPYNKSTHRIRSLSSWRRGASRPAFRASRTRW